MLQNVIAALDVHPAHPVDRLWHAMLAGTIQPLSPGSINLAVTDWLTHLNMHPAKQGELLAKAADQWLRLINWAACELRDERQAPCIDPLPQDKRFRDEEWQQWPFNLFGEPPRGTEDYPVGKRLAVTPGKVIYRNRLIELIQYSPATGRVKPQPVLIVPAWIMKYYILDLQPEDSLVKYLVDRGYSVFMISWKNPGPEERDFGFDDYRRLGVMAALDAIGTVVPGRKIHSVGYCIGGTLLTVAAAHMARVDDDRLQSLTLFAALTDFSEPGQLGLFIDPSQMAYLEDLMWERGYLGGARMRSVFFFLRSLDLIWSRNVRSYLLGKPRKMFDLMAWNADTTNMPYRMHAEYLRRFYLNNDLVEGRFEIDDEPVMLLDIRVPIFTVGTTRDHIAPWKSVYKINRLTRTEVTFLLTTGGHNVGVVNPPGESRYAYQIRTRHPRDKYLSADAFHERGDWHQGSWWPAWEAWLAERSEAPVAPPRVGAPNKGYPILTDAPGKYVFESARVF